MPGTTLSRLLVDPADGQLVERTITRYRPDADMRRQVIAADVHSRAPGSRVPAGAGELDHVIPFGAPGGVTGELNLQALNVRSHQFKTARAWSAAINHRRDVRWHTLLGQATTTRVHDYRAYLDRLAPLDPDLADQHPTERDDLAARRDLACRALLAALHHRGPDAFLSDLDDEADDGSPLTSWATVRPSRASADTGPSPEEILAPGDTISLDAPQGELDDEGPDDEGPDDEGPHDDRPWGSTSPGSPPF